MTPLRAHRAARRRIGSPKHPLQWTSVRRHAVTMASVAVLWGQSNDAHASDLSMGVTSEVTGYQDTDATSVITPGVRVDVEGVTGGWGVGAAMLVDVVTAASADIVATASPRWMDVRYVPALDARFPVGDSTFSVAGGASLESDYWAGSGTVGWSSDFMDKRVTPSVSYGFGYDVAGRRGTPTSVYSLELQRHSLNAAVSIVLDQATIVVPGVSAVVEVGDQEKPYRYLPTFAPGTELDNGASRDEVDRARTSVRLAENTPNLRHRYALSALFAHRFGSATVRVDERLYVDSWMLLASTTDFLLPVDVTSWLRLWPHARAHIQKGVSFWSKSYEVEIASSGEVIAPQLRAGDRELGPMFAGTLGGGARFGGNHFGVSLSADAIYSRFFEQLYIQDRLAGFAAVTVDVEVD
jgi:hypothetical protein